MCVVEKEKTKTSQIRETKFSPKISQKFCFVSKSTPCGTMDCNPEWPLAKHKQTTQTN